MHFGVTVPNFGDYYDPRHVAELAREAEDSGWDGFFVWDHITWSTQVPVADPWVTLTAVAMSTARVRLGPMVTALPRRRPWKVARETTTLDHLSGGRLILGVGLGFHQREEFESLGEDGDPKVRAEKLDEGLDVLTGLWSGSEFSYRGKHFEVTNVRFQPEPVQEPRIPIWVAGTWPIKAPFRRAARWDGVFPMNPFTPSQLRDVIGYVKEHRASVAPFDVVCPGRTEGRGDSQDAETVAALGEAGLTWWIELYRPLLPDLRERIRIGPPRV